MADMTLTEMKLLRGYIIYILNGKYPHHVQRILLDHALKHLQQWKGDRETLSEIVFLRQIGFLEWEKTPDPEDPETMLYSYCLTAEGRKLAIGQIVHPDVSMIKR